MMELRVGYAAVGVVDRPGVGHHGREYRSAAVAFEAVTHLVVDFVAAHALEEELEVEALPISAEVEAVVEPGYGGAEVHAVVAVDYAVAVVVGVFGVADVIGYALGGVAVEIVEGFLVGAEDAEVVVAVEVVERVSLVDNLHAFEVGIDGRAAVEGRELVVDKADIAADGVGEVLTDIVAVLEGDFNAFVAYLAHVGSGAVTVAHMRGR